MGTRAFSDDQKAGLLYCLGAVAAWGLLPIFWKQLKHVPSAEILAHRVIWSFVFYTSIVAFYSQLGIAFQVLKQKNSFLFFLLMGSLIGSNWFTYIYAVNSGHILEASLGYFLTPLVNVALGLLFFEERLSPRGWLAVLLAILGVAVLATFNDRFPWFAVVLAVTFGAYGLTKKKMKTDPLAAAGLETMMITFPAIVFAFYAAHSSSAQKDLMTWTLLISSGVITGLPLLWYAQAVRRLKFSTVGFLGYLSPTLQFSLAVFAYQETFIKTHALGFGLVWAAIAIYSIDAVSGRRKG